MTIKISFGRSSQKGGRQGFEKRVNRGPTLKFYCRPEALGETAFWKSHFYCRRFFPGNTVTIILDNYPPSTLQGVEVGGHKNPKIIVGENSCHFGASYLQLIFGKGMRTATFHFSEAGNSLNRPDLFTELPFL